MRYFLSSLSLLLLLVAVRPAAAQQAADTVSAHRRPRVGVVLSGGGAKGSAHIGVLKYMEEMGIPVDYVAGTSMGSIMGGLYAMGYSADDLADLIASLDWSVYMRNNIERRYVSFAKKEMNSTYQLSVPFGRDDIARKQNSGGSAQQKLISTLPNAFVTGSNLLNLFNNLSLGYQDSISFDSMPIPFACVATDLYTGDGVVLRGGRFAKAIRSSMAIPGVFSPVVVDDYLLVDGGLYNNFPADICRDMGADIIIGSEVVEELKTDLDHLQSLPQLLNQLMNVLVKGDRVENKKRCDIYVHPDITGYNMLSFSHASIDTLVARGYREAQKYHDQFVALRERLQAYGPLTQRFQSPPATNFLTDTVRLYSITMNGVTDKERQWLLRKSGLETGVPLTGNDVENVVSIFNGTGCYSDITYSLSLAKHKGDTIKSLGMREEYDWYHITFNFVPAKPHNFSFGFRYDFEESAALAVGLGFNQNRISGLKALLRLRLAYNPKFDADVSLGAKGLGSVHLACNLHERNVVIFNTAESRTLVSCFSAKGLFYFSELHLRDYSLTFGIDDDFYTFLQVANTDNSAEHNELYSGDHNSAGLFVRFLYDTRDDAYFARYGMLSHIEGSWRVNTVEGESVSQRVNNDSYGNVMLKWQSFSTPGGGRFTFAPQVCLRAVIGNNDFLPYANMVGGVMDGRFFSQQLPFFGTTNAWMMGDMVAILRCDLRWNVTGSHNVVVVANALRSTDEAYDFFRQSDDDCNAVGVGIRYAYQSLVGPLMADLYWSSLTHQWGFALSIGYDF